MHTHIYPWKYIRSTHERLRIHTHTRADTHSHTHTHTPLVCVCVCVCWVHNRSSSAQSCVLPPFGLAACEISVFGFSPFLIKCAVNFRVIVTTTFFIRQVSVVVDVNSNRQGDTWLHGSYFYTCLLVYLIVSFGCWLSSRFVAPRRL
jgi:hypothetical protein